MGVSSGTVSLFTGAAVAISVAFCGAFALKNPELARNAANTYFPETYSKYKEIIIGRPAPAPTAAVTKAASQSSYGDVTLTSDSSGHFQTDAEINGRSINAMVDTGATLVALTYEDAERAGIFLRPSDFTHKVSTANGVAKVAPIKISRISIGDITVRDVEGAVSERGAMRQTLLGMTFLSRLSRVDMRAGTLVLKE